jgi:hypothetical protein
VVLLSWFDTLGQTITSVADNAGGTYTLDKPTTNGSDKFSIYSRHAASGLALGSVITVTFSGNPAGGFLIGAASFTGIDSTGSAVDTTGSTTGTGTSWSSGAATNALADALFVGGSGNEAVATTVPYTAGTGTKVHDRYRAADGQGFAPRTRSLRTVAARSVGGTWASTSTANTGALVIYKAAPLPPPP